jgi:integrase/recombinase XerD
MSDKSLLGPWVRRFLLEYAVKERNLARNTQHSYRDTLSLLIPFIANKAGNQVERLKVIDASADRVRLFLSDLEETRGCCVTTRNQRLAAIHALARFIGLHSPEHIEWCGEVRAIAFKRSHTLRKTRWMLC